MVGGSEIESVSIADVEKAVMSVCEVLAWYERWADHPGTAIERATVDPLLWSLGGTPGCRGSARRGSV